MSATNSDIYILVGEELGLISGNETMSADDLDKISRRAAKVRAWLIDESLVYWVDNTVPDAAAIPYAKIIAGQAAEVFGRGQGSSSPYLGGDEGFRALERHVSQRSAKEPVIADYF